MKRHYRIELYWEFNDSWNLLNTWEYMPFGKASGAWMVIKSFLGTNQKYRLVCSDGTIEEHHTGKVVVN